MSRGGLRARTVCRRRLMARQSGLCCYCGVPMTPPVDGHRGPLTAATIDHLLPRSRGGTDDPGNLALACRRCNSRKTDLTPDEFLLARRFGLA